MPHKCRMALLLAAVLGAGWSSTGWADGRKGSVTVRFVRLAEKRVGSRDHLAIVVRQLEGEQTTLLVLPAKGEVRDVARNLKAGEKISVGYVTEGGATWATRIGRQEGDREGDRDRDGQAGDRDREGEGKGRPRDGDREGQRPRRERDGEDRKEKRGDGDREDKGRGERAAEDREREGRDRDKGQVERQSRELRVLVRRLLERVEKLEVRVKDLEEQNAALRKALAGE